MMETLSLRYVKNLIYRSGLSQTAILLLLFYVENPIDAGETWEDYITRSGLSIRSTYRARLELINAGIVCKEWFSENYMAEKRNLFYWKEIQKYRTLYPASTWKDIYDKVPTKYKNYDSLRKAMNNIDLRIAKSRKD